MKTNNTRLFFRTLALSLQPLALLLLAGCSHLGPKTVAVDRFDYSTAIADSWKQQTLLNIVKIRYMDLPVFVDVASIVSGYSMQTGVSVNGTLSSQNAVQGNFLAAGGQAIYTDRPTVTYVPLTGEKFLRGLVTPIDPKNIFFMIQAGYPADFLLGLTVESLNGVRNRSTGGGVVREADAEFVRALDLLRQVQAAGDGHVGTEIVHGKPFFCRRVCRVLRKTEAVAPEIISAASAFSAVSQSLRFALISPIRSAYWSGVSVAGSWGSLQMGRGQRGSVLKRGTRCQCMWGTMLPSSS